MVRCDNAGIVSTIPVDFLLEQALLVPHYPLYPHTIPFRPWQPQEEHEEKMYDFCDAVQKDEWV